MDKKALNFPILLSLVIGNLIGTGIYILPASLAQYGTISLLSWLYTSIGALFLALTFARLNKHYPKTGGPYAFCKEAFGKQIGFVVAYTYWLSNLVSIAGIAVSSIGYLGFITPHLNANSHLYNHTSALMIELIVVWFFTFINILGIHTAGVVQLFLTIIKIIPLILITVMGFSHIHLENLTQFNISAQSNWAAFSGAAALTFWAFIGLESATVPAENTQGPADIYKATVFGTLIVALIYIASTFVLMGMFPAAELKNSQFPFAQSATLLFGAHSAFIIALCAVLSGLGALNVCILIQGQIVFAAARDQLFPKYFAKLSKHDVPIAGQLLSSICISIFLILTTAPTLLQQFDNIALLAGILTLFTYFMTTLAEVKLLKNNFFSFKTFFTKSVFITLLAVLYTFWMITNFKFSFLLLSLCIIIFSIPLYFFVIARLRKD